MNEYEKKRKKLFDIYSDNLKLLLDSGLIKAELNLKKNYICPLCLGQFSEEDLDTSSFKFLTLEDVPPVAIGGKPLVLTCNSCNNYLGTNIDYHLITQMQDLEFFKGDPAGTKITRAFIDGKFAVKGTLRPEGKGNFSILISNDNNNLALVTEHIARIKKGEIISTEFTQRKAIEKEKIALAILKSAYLLLFYKLGYAYILDNCYSSIRKTLLDPQRKNKFIPYIYQFNEHPISKPFGIYLMKYTREKHFREQSFIAVFSVQTKQGFRRSFGVWLPIPGFSLEKAINIFHHTTFFAKEFPPFFPTPGEAITNIREIFTLNREIYMN